jgi:hypothetical protein
MTAGVRYAALIGLLVFAVGCSAGNAPTTPTPPPSPPAPVQPPPALDVPPLEGPSSLYLFSGTLAYPVSDYTKHSRYVLYDNGAFALHFPTVTVNPYLGAYVIQNNQVLFNFAGSSQWNATATVNGDSLEVLYSQMMQHADFENAIYTRAH